MSEIGYPRHCGEGVSGFLMYTHGGQLRKSQGQGRIEQGHGQIGGPYTRHLVLQDPTPCVQLSVSGQYIIHVIRLTRNRLAERDSELRMLRQFVKLTGVGAMLYNELPGIFDTVHGAFAQALAPAKVRPIDWNKYNGQYAMDVHTHYFTEHCHASALAHQPFPVDIDPEHVLKEI